MNWTNFIEMKSHFWNIKSQHNEIRKYVPICRLTFSILQGWVKLDLHLSSFFKYMNLHEICKILLGLLCLSCNLKLTHRRIFGSSYVDEELFEKPITFCVLILSLHPSLSFFYSCLLRLPAKWQRLPELHIVCPWTGDVVKPLLPVVRY